MHLSLLIAVLVFLELVLKYNKIHVQTNTESVLCNLIVTLSVCRYPEGD